MYIQENRSYQFRKSKRRSRVHTKKIECKCFEVRDLWKSKSIRRIIHWAMRYSNGVRGCNRYLLRIIISFMYGQM